MKITAVIVAAGSGVRMGAKGNKVFLKLAHCTILEHTLNTFEAHKQIDNIVLVVRECDMLKCKKLIKSINKPVKLVTGGATRQASVFNGLMAIPDTDIAVIHDGARALVTEKVISDTICDAKKYGAAAAGVLCKDSLKCADSEGFISATIDRDSTYQIQTPQIFKYEEILRAHKIAEDDKFLATDDCALYEKYIGKIKITQGSYDNIKLTTPEDMVVAKNIMKKSGAIGLKRISRKVKNVFKIFQNK